MIKLAMRHARAVDSHRDGDHARPLTDEGRKVAEGMFAELARRGLEPTRMLVSSAARTRETAASGPECELRFLDELYNADAEAIAALVNRNSEETDGPIMVVAHNPGISAYAAISGVLAPADVVVIDPDGRREHIRARAVA